MNTVMFWVLRFFKSPHRKQNKEITENFSMTFEVNTDVDIGVFQGNIQLTT